MSAIKECDWHIHDEIEASFRELGKINAGKQRAQSGVWHGNKSTCDGNVSAFSTGRLQLEHKPQPVSSTQDEGKEAVSGWVLWTIIVPNAYQRKTRSSQSPSHSVKIQEQIDGFIVDGTYQLTGQQIPDQQRLKISPDNMLEGRSRGPLGDFTSVVQFEPGITNWHVTKNIANEEVQMIGYWAMYDLRREFIIGFCWANSKRALITIMVLMLREVMKGYFIKSAFLDQIKTRKYNKDFPWDDDIEMHFQSLRYKAKSDLDFYINGEPEASKSDSYNPHKGILKRNKFEASKGISSIQNKLNKDKDTLQQSRKEKTNISSTIGKLH